MLELKSRFYNFCPQLEKKLSLSALPWSPCPYIFYYFPQDHIFCLNHEGSTCNGETVFPMGLRTPLRRPTFGLRTEHWRPLGGSIWEGALQDSSPASSRHVWCRKTGGRCSSQSIKWHTEGYESDDPGKGAKSAAICQNTFPSPLVKQRYGPF